LSIPPHLHVRFIFGDWGTFITLTSVERYLVSGQRLGKWNGTRKKKKQNENGLGNTFFPFVGERSSLITDLPSCTSPHCRNSIENHWYTITHYENTLLYLLKYDRTPVTKNQMLVVIVRKYYSQISTLTRQ